MKADLILAIHRTFEVIGAITCACTLITLIASGIALRIQERGKSRIRRSRGGNTLFDDRIITK